MQNNDNIDTNPIDKSKTSDDNENENDVNVLSGDNKVDVEIEPDVKANKINMYVQICSCSIIFHCFSNNKEK
jgi:hypothetical protein